MKIPFNDNILLLPGFFDKKFGEINGGENMFENNDLFLKVNHLLTNEESDKLLLFFHDNNKIQTNDFAIKKKYGNSPTGIKRSCFYDELLANSISKKIWLKINEIEIKDGEKFKFIGLNPLIRFISYESNNNKLIPHYDVNVNISDKIKTLKTIVIYLNNCESGKTNFLKDHRVEHNFTDANQDDVFEIIDSQKPEKGNAIIFDHFIFHESEGIKNNDKKTIITTELCYEKIY